MFPFLVCHFWSKVTKPVLAEMTKGNESYECDLARAPSQQAVADAIKRLKTRFAVQGFVFVGDQKFL